MSAFVLTVLVTLREALDWFNQQPGGTQTLIGIVLAAVLASVGSSAWWVTTRIVGLSKQYIASKRAAADAKRKRLEDEPPIGLVEALIAEEEALHRLPQHVEALSDAMTKGVARQQQIKEKMGRINYGSANAKHQANKMFLEHADNYNRTGKIMRKAIDLLAHDVKLLRECQQRYIDWNRMNAIEKPPDSWIKDYDFVIGFRDKVRNLHATVKPEVLDKRWDAQVRAMNRKFDRSIRDFVKVNSELALACEQLDGMCTFAIDTVDKWKRKGLGGLFR